MFDKISPECDKFHVKRVIFLCIRVFDGSLPPRIHPGGHFHPRRENEADVMPNQRVACRSTSGCATFMRSESFGVFRAYTPSTWRAASPGTNLST